MENQDNQIVASTPETALAPIALKRADGRSMGSKYSFIGRTSAASIRSELKATGLKGKALSTEINRVLTGSASLANVKATAFLQMAIESGAVPVEGKVNANAEVFTMRLEVPKAPKDSKAVTGKVAALTEGIKAAIEAAKKAGQSNIVKLLEAQLA